LLSAQGTACFFQSPAQGTAQGGSQITGQPGFGGEPADKGVFLYFDGHGLNPALLCMKVPSRALTLEFLSLCVVAAARKSGPAMLVIFLYGQEKIFFIVR
jgi:hypothetical protein